ncbi:MAG: LysR family transcriptional regulator [Pseudomonadota bacterium]
MRNAAEIAFLKAVETGSIRAAARAMGQDPSGVSRRIAQLERRLGTRLLARSGSAATPTAQGLLYYERLKRVLDQLDVLEAEISGENLAPSGRLRVTAAIDFGQEFVTDWMLEYRRLHPEVDFDLTLAGGYVDFTQSGLDVALRVGALPDSGLIVRKLADVPRVLVASPAYLARHGTPRRPEDLAQHAFVFFSPRHRSEPLVLYDKAGKRYAVERNGRVSVNAVRSAVKAVLADQGVHSGPLWAFARQIDTGAVVELLPAFQQAVLPLYAVRQPSPVVPARISSFISFCARKVKTIDGLV